ncbi:MAG TPA: hypothetical protein VH764_04330 [Gemmatimonadales bacterium]|jgi:hypothetical protein
MRRGLICLLALGALAGCKRDAPEPHAARTERQRDSVIGASQLPGARGVAGALKASDSAAARRAREDAAAQEP